MGFTLQPDRNPGAEIAKQVDFLVRLAGDFNGKTLNT